MKKQTYTPVGVNTKLRGYITGTGNITTTGNPTTGCNKNVHLNTNNAQIEKLIKTTLKK